MINEKMMKAIQILKPNVECTIFSNEETEENFNKIKWTTGVDSNGLAITTTTNPHSELSYSAVKTEMDKL
jgi:hypothetical protein